MNRPGLFIAFEGIDYSGKTTQATNLRTWLGKELGSRRVRLMAEPIELAIDQKIRKILCGAEEAPPSFFEFQRLFVLDRAYDVHWFIRPGLEKGYVEIRDRYALSTIAYGMLSGTDEEYFRLHYDVVGPGMCWPNITFLIDIPVEVAFGRMDLMGVSPEFFEKKENLQRVRENYLILANQHQYGTIRVIDGTRHQSEIFEEIKSELGIYLKTYRRKESL